MPHIIIDGYNYIHRISSSDIHADINMDMLRRTFLERFAKYKRRKDIKITVVFDAYKGFSTGRQRENYKGINVVYSKENETADDVMIGWIREKKEGVIVVTSDRSIIDEAKRYNITFVVPSQFEAMISQVGLEIDKEESEEGTYNVKKKGNPRKLPKRLRRVKTTLNKIR